MNTTNGIVISILITAFILLFPQLSLADGFDGADLLEWSQDSQRFYIEASASMAGVIVAQSDPDLARCIDEWHAREHAMQYAETLKSIRSYPTYHPQGVLFAILRQACPGPW